MNARLTAYKVLTRVEHDGAYSNLALMHELDRDPDAQEADRRLATELVYGTLRSHRLLDHWINHLANRPSSRIDPAVARVLHISLYQLLKLDRIPDHAVLAEAGKLLRKIERKHAVGFANALLRRMLRERKADQSPRFPKDPLRRLAIEQSIPDWLMDRWVDELQPDHNDPKKLLARLQEHCEYLNRPAPLTLLPNPIGNDIDSLANDLEAAGHRIQRGEYASHAIHVSGAGLSAVARAVGEGRCHIMDEAAQLVGELLEPQPGDRILDLCAAPGGKSLMAAGRTGPRGHVLSVDISKTKLGLLERQAKAHGYSWLKTLAADARQPIPGLEPNSFDRVLVDAPCSALGIVRRHPEIRWRRKAEDIPRMADRSAVILDNAIRYLKTGGVLVFSVCTTTREEGPQQMAAFLDATDWRFERSETIDDGLWVTENGQPCFSTAAAPVMDGFFAFRLRRK